MPAPLAAPSLSVAPAASTSGSTSDTTAAISGAVKAAPVPVTPVASVTSTSTPTVSPTVVTDSNIRENTIPTVQSNAAVVTKPAANGPTPTTTKNPDGTPATGKIPATSSTGNNDTTVTDPDTNYLDLYNKALGIENGQPIDPITQQELNLISSTKSSTDAGYNAQIAAVTAQYAQVQKLAQTAAATRQAEETYQGEKNGTSSSTTQSILSAENTADLNEMASLTNDENTSIANIQSSMAKDDYQSAQDSIAALEKIQSDRSALAQKTADSLETQNQKLQDTITQSQHDSQIVKLFSSGTTDPSAILKQLNANGGDFTLSEINTALTNLASQSDKDISELTGDTKNFFDLQKMGALPSTITSLPKDQQLSAYLKMGAASTANSKVLFTGSNGTTVTQGDISSGVQGLENSGTATQATNPATGKPYANPATYEAMYTAWVESGLEPQSFLKTYPASAYLDPNDISSLPSYLQPSGSQSISNPFGDDASSTSDDNQ